MVVRPNAGPSPSAHSSGLELASMLAARYPDEDWLAAIAKGAVMPRADVERALQSPEPPPGSILRAIEDIDLTLTPGDPAADDHVFAARDASGAARMEVDAEAGLNVLVSPKTSPSKSGSPYEAGEDKDQRMVDDSLP